MHTLFLTQKILWLYSKKYEKRRQQFDQPHRQDAWRLFYDLVPV